MMIQFNSLFLTLSTALALFLARGDAFTARNAATTRKPSFVSSFSSSSSSSSSSLLRAASSLDDELHDLDQARARFEEMAMMQETNNKHHQNQLGLAHCKEDYTPRPLTESSRRRRVIEMELLESLRDSDDAIEELMSLWMIERGQKAAEQLQEMEAICSPGLTKEETILERMTQEYPHWAEPFSRLASLLYFKGRTEESEELCQVAFAIKPWHFEVAHTGVLNALRNQDTKEAIRWQRRALPPLNPETNNKARKAWVEQALKDAQDNLEKAQAAAIAKKRGEENTSTSNNNMQAGEVWQ